MQARESEQQHDDEHRVLSSSTNSSTTDERLCEPIALPSGGALVRAAPNSAVFGRRSRPPSAPPAPDTTLLPSSSADLRVLRIPPGPDHPGGTMLQVTSRWSEIALPGHADTATGAGTSVANPLADASSSGAPTLKFGAILTGLATAIHDGPPCQQWSKHVAQRSRLRAASPRWCACRHAKQSSTPQC